MHQGAALASTGMHVAAHAPQGGASLAQEGAGL